MTSYDAVIIGAGIAGLTAGAYLTKGGARVLLCEQASYVGGLFHSFWRQGYLFDGGIKALENAGLILPTLIQLGLGERITFVNSPIAMITQDHVQPIRSMADVDAYFQHLMVLFPAEREGLQQVLDDVRHIFGLLSALLHFPNLFARSAAEREGLSSWLKRHGAALSRTPRVLSLLNQPLRGYVERRIRNPNLANLLCDLFPDGTTAFFGLGYFGILLDYYYPHGGMGALPRVLGEAIQEWGGEILTHARVARVLLEERRACGVVLADGREVHADYVLAANDGRQLFTQLLPEGALPSPFLRRVQRAEVSHTAFNVFLGLDLPPDQLKLQDCGHVFYAPDLDGITEADRLDREDYFVHVPQEISVPCLHDPALAPPGKSGLILSCMTHWRYAGGWGAQEGQPEAYERMKERCARGMIGSLERFIPGLSGRIELCVIATPRTLYTRTLNSEGAIMGWSYHREKTLHRGGFLQMPQATGTPIPHLLMAGHWSFSPGGSPVAILTAKLAADRILKDIR
jgi:phytoene dehydrogenase-like protein